MKREIEINKKDLFDSEIIYNKLRGDKERYTPFHKWISRHISAWGFQENKDYWTILSRKTRGRPATKYYITIDMVKQLCMLDKSDIGRKVRDYYIDIEKERAMTKAERLAGIELRKSLTDQIKESGENERMHGHAFSTYTKLAYKYCNIKYDKQKNFRDTLTAEQLSNLKTVEEMIKCMIKLGKKYKDIKNVLEPLLGGR